MTRRLIREKALARYGDYAKVVPGPEPADPGGSAIGRRWSRQREGRGVSIVPATDRAVECTFATETCRPIQLQRRMKQKKFGKKIQNWHRPLGPSQLRRRFLRHRHDDPEVTSEGRYRHYPIPVDDCWNCYDPHVGYESYESDDFSVNLNHLWSEIAEPYPPYVTLEVPTGNAPSHPPENTAVSAASGRDSDTAIEERLAAYVERLTHLSSNDRVLVRNRIQGAIGAPANLDIVRSEYPGHQDAIRRICLFSPFWQRSPSTWNKDSGTHLVDHLFVLHDVPRCLHAEFLRPFPQYRGGRLYQQLEPVTYLRFKWLCWFIILGQGGSLRRAARLLDWKVASKLQRHLWDAPPDATPAVACIFAEVKRLGGSDVEFRRICRSGGFILDPTEQSESESHRRFWQNTVRWLTTHRDDITDEESESILSWAMHEYTEGQRLGGRPFTWKGRRVRTVLERSIEYSRQLERPWSQYQWQAHGWNWTLEEEPQSTWSFVELTSGEELFREGQAMHHCVAGYAARCASGHSAIVSVLHNGMRRITVEINPKTRQVVQARGPCNRPAQPEERRAISLWLRAVVHRTHPGEQA